MPEFKKAAHTTKIPSGSGKSVEVSGKTLAVFNAGGKFYAVDNTCLHRGGPLGEGMLEGTAVTCPWHGWQYDIQTGICATNPQMRIRTYQTKLEGDDIWVLI